MAASTTLALLGGEPAIPFTLPPYSSLGEEEEAAVVRVVRSGRLSQFVGSWDPDFFGGEEVRAFELEFAEVFGVR